MKKFELIVLFKSLRGMSDLRGIKFCYFISKVEKKLAPEMHNIDQANPQLKDDFSEKTAEEKKKLAEEFNSFLQEEGGVELPVIELKNVPENITVGQFTALKELIKEN